MTTQTKELISPVTQPTKRKSYWLEVAIVVGLALIVLLIIPPVLNSMGLGFRVNMLGRFMALAIVALGIDLIWGYTGLLSLGHGIFFALGGYAFAMYLELQLPDDQIPAFFGLYGVTDLPWLWRPFYSLPFTLGAIVLVPSIVAAVLGYLVFRNRIRGVYFAILTQAALIVFFNFFNGQQQLINGTNGLKTDTARIFGEFVSSPQIQSLFYSLTAVFLVLGYVLCRWLTSGRFGRLLVAIRDDESRVRFSGYDPTGFKVMVFAVSAGLAGIAGALYTVQSGIVSPRTMDIAFSIEMVIWVAVGGRATLIGAILGALLVNFAKSFLSEQFPDIWLFFQGALFLVVVTVLPGGIVGWIREDAREQLRQLFRIRPQIATYPSLEEDLDIRHEQQHISHQESDG
ncbi:urea ABC transporter permease subunit UrtC [Synechococcales cyanobacterium C]|uniref:Urea ABC transporter permease subunit UrtC n=1 Tax=Petrachloros mirabilis ULC683 TaxID=2781853 RepID=A0A8K2A899_9CYAN|nr:urea ABC transporter permease subunit UrtC [Petrachloros mirabilis]NCJ07776.1 urea ABC transporter permease subunit UrtC [Petrachloros mirabilis ULC683]